jgi:hypothetical protein
MANESYVPESLPIDWQPRTGGRDDDCPNVPTRNADVSRYAVRVADSTGHTDGWQVWQGSHFAADGSEIGHAVPGARTRRTVRGEHMAWCGALVRVGTRTRQCEELHRCYVSVEGGHGQHWSCPVHGADSVTGALVPAGLDDGRAERVKVTRYADNGQAKGTVLAANDRGDTITNGKRGSYGFRSKGKRGQAVYPEPSEPMMASGRWSTRTRAATPDSGKVLVYGLSVFARADLFGRAAPHAVATRIGHVPAMAWHRESGYLLRVLTSRGTMVKRGLPARTMASVLARDARAAEVVAAQVKRYAPARSRAAGLAAATRRRTGAQVRVNAKAAATRKANSAARVAAVMAKVHAAL